MFGAHAEKSSINLMHKITLNDAKLYEEVALKQGAEFVEIMMKHYSDLEAQGSGQVDDFLGSYCSHAAKSKQEKVRGWKKYACEACGECPDEPF